MQLDERRNGYSKKGVGMEKEVVMNRVQVKRSGVESSTLWGVWDTLKDKLELRAKPPMAEHLLPVCAVARQPMGNGLVKITYLR